MPAIECILLTGFLGSGKTTLLNAFLRSPQARGTAVVVNEVGDIGIDQLVLAEVAENLLLLESGCLCCTLTGTLRETLLDLVSKSRQNGYPLTRIVIETTGLAEPLPILHSLIGDKALTDVVHLSQVVVTVDAVNGVDQMQRHPECARQVAAAELAVVTKSDLASAEQRARVHDAIRQINPLAECVEAVAGAGVENLLLRGASSAQQHARAETLAGKSAAGLFPAQGQLAAFRTLAKQAGPASANADKDGAYLGKAQAYHQRIRTESFYVDDPVHWPGVAAWWHMLVHRYGKDLLRCKGLLRVADPSQPYAFIQGVGEFFHPPQYLSEWPDSDPRSRVICIGAGLERAWLQHSLRALRIDEPGLRPSTLDELDSVLPEKT